MSLLIKSMITIRIEKWLNIDIHLITSFWFDCPYTDACICFVRDLIATQIQSKSSFVHKAERWAILDFR